MSRTVLVTDIETDLGDALARKLLCEECRVVGLRCGQARNRIDLSAGDRAFSVFDWDRASPLSARTVFLKILNSLEAVDEALLIFDPDLERRALTELTFSEVERAVDRWVKGTLFMAREVLGHFRQRRSGLLGLVHYPRGEAGVRPPLESTLRGSFQGLAQSLLAGGGREPILVHGFESQGGEPEPFAEFILAALKDKARKGSGRWFRHQERPGLFTLKNHRLRETS